MSTNFGLDTKESCGDFSNYVGNYVRIFSNGNTFYGKLIVSEWDGFTQLNPSLIDYSTPLNNVAVIDKKTPTMINTSTITSIQPIKKKLLEDICSDVIKKNIIEKEKKEKKEEKN
jgi:hypothetical protein